MEKHDVMTQRGDPSQHRSQGIVERFNRTLADRLFSFQYHKELEDPLKSNREWVSRLQNVVQFSSFYFNNFMNTKEDTFTIKMYNTSRKKERKKQTVNYYKNQI